ncbi:MAG: cell division protein ZipA [bacterium]
MEFGAREIMIVVGALVLVAIVLDVIRRVRASRYENIRMSKRRRPKFDGDDDQDEVYTNELPSGGARVVGYRDEEDAEKVTEYFKQTSDKKYALKSFQTLLSPDETALREPAVDPAGESDLSLQEAEADSVQEPDEPEQSPIAKAEAETEVEAEAEVEAQEEQTVEQPAPADPPKQASLDLDDSAPEGPVIVIHLMAEKGQQLPGDALRDGLLDKGLRYGSMRIFHRHEQESGAGEVMFSVANAINPGTFDLNEMDDIETPGVTFFFAASDVPDPKQSFDLMVETAESLREQLGGELKDESRSVLRAQTIEHYRQQITDFTRARLAGAK